MVSWDIKRVTAPQDTPVSVQEAKDQMRVETPDEDAMIERLIKAATEYVEGPYGIGIVLAEQTWGLKLDRFPHDAISLPIYPVQSVDSITYTDTAGAEQTVSPAVYRVDTHSNPARITLEWGQSWPTARLVANSVTVTFTAGFPPENGDYRANIPETLRHVILMLVTHWYEKRDPVAVGSIVNDLPMAVQSILDRYRVSGIA